jgi:hypothetical protein
MHTAFLIAGRAGEKKAIHKKQKFAGCRILPKIEG